MSHTLRGQDGVPSHARSGVLSGSCHAPECLPPPPLPHRPQPYECLQYTKQQKQWLSNVSSQLLARAKYTLCDNPTNPKGPHQHFTMSRATAYLHAHHAPSVPTHAGCSRASPSRAERVSSAPGRAARHPLSPMQIRGTHKQLILSRLSKQRVQISNQFPQQPPPPLQLIHNTQHPPLPQYIFKRSSTRGVPHTHAFEHIQTNQTHTLSSAVYRASANFEKL